MKYNISKWQSFGLRCGLVGWLIGLFSWLTGRLVDWYFISFEQFQVSTYVGNYIYSLLFFVSVRVIFFIDDFLTFSFKFRWTPFFSLFLISIFPLFSQKMGYPTIPNERNPRPNKQATHQPTYLTRANQATNQPTTQMLKLSLKCAILSKNGVNHPKKQHANAQQPPSNLPNQPINQLVDQSTS